MNVQDLIAIDVHTHAEVSCRQPVDEGVIKGSSFTRRGRNGRFGKWQAACVPRSPRTGRLPRIDEKLFTAQYFFDCMLPGVLVRLAGIRTGYLQLPYL